MPNPQFICKNCKKVNQLLFDPRKDYERLKDTVCEYCRKMLIDEKVRKELVDEKLWEEAGQNDKENI